MGGSLPAAAILVLTSLPDVETARRIARELVEARLAACVQIGAPVESLYHWQGRIETATEIPLAIKTRSDAFSGTVAGDPRAPPVRTSRDRGGRPDRWPPDYLRWITTETRLRELALLAVALVVVAPAGAQTAGGPKLLPAEEAFKLSARALDARTLEVRFNVADGYYLYRDKLRFKVEPAPIAAGTPALPPGKPHKDEFFGESVIYRGLMVARLPIQGAKAGQPVTLVADSQGCADAGVCYPPQTQRVELKLPAPVPDPRSPRGHAAEKGLLQVRVRAPTLIATICLRSARAGRRRLVRPRRGSTPSRRRPACHAPARHHAPDPEGKDQSLAQWKGKILVVNFWATWCAPCREEMPMFMRLQDASGRRACSSSASRSTTSTRFASTPATSSSTIRR
jgi:uncharacterized protein involved in tolerance to divalent cations